ncbi:MAG: PilZ domain-containing protein [Bdellovibrionota bacterium]
MSDKGRYDQKFAPITDLPKINSSLAECAKVLAPAVVWTRNQEQRIESRAGSWSPGDRIIAVAYTGAAKDTSGIPLPREVNAIYVNFTLPHTTVFFRTTFLGLDRKRGLLFTGPTEMFEVQRREAFRLRMSDSYGVHAQFSYPVGTPAQTRKVVDISSGGLAFIVPTEAIHKFVPGQQLGRLDFQLRSREFKTLAEIRHTSGWPPWEKVQDGLKVGVRFSSLTAEESNFIAVFVLEESRKIFTSRF